MSTAAVLIQEPEIVGVPVPPALAPRVSFRLRPVMRQGTAASLPQTWERYPTVEAARAAAKLLYHDDRVLRVLLVADELPPRFVEWIER